MLELLKANKAIVGYIASAVALALSIFQLYDWVYDKGYDSAVVAMQVAYNEAAEAEKKKTELKIKSAMELQATLHDKELKRVASEQKVKTVTVEVIKYVDRIEVSDQCIGLAGDTVRLLGKATDIVTTRKSGGSAKAEGKPGT